MELKEKKKREKNEGEGEGVRRLKWNVESRVFLFYFICLYFKLMYKMTYFLC